MITIEGQDFYNFAEALLYLFELYKEVYSKEELDEILSKVRGDYQSLSQALNTLAQNLQNNYYDRNYIDELEEQNLIYRNQFDAVIRVFAQDIRELKETRPTITQVQQLIQQELGVIENGSY